MCGIAGMVGPRGRQANRGHLERMIRMLGHRGPDERGVYVDREAGLAHARLSIIDLSGGKQPMTSAAGDLALTFNGEIFNYLELRDSLAQRGHRFATSSDTEVILHQYQAHGAEGVQEMNGQWAFALWDGPKRELFLSRDRMGILPLYYTVVDGTFLFASEVKALFAHPAVPRRLDFKGLDQLFTFWHPVAGRTVFEGVRELPPGHSLRWKDGQITIWPYWQMRFDPPAERLSDEEYVERLLDLLIDATRLRLRADVPVGAYLSGGLDSSVITGLIRRYTDTPLKTFSVVFEDAEFDERGYQDQVVRHLGTQHERLPCRRQDIAAAFPDVVWHAEKPMLRTAPVPLYYLSGLVREHGYKVVLTGEGSDELLGGYDLFKEAKIRRFWAAQPQSRWRPLLLKRLYPYLPQVQAQPAAYLKAFFHVGPDDLANPFFSHLPRWELTARLKALFSHEVRAELAEYDATADFRAILPEGFDHWAPFCQAQYLEATGLMPGYILSSQGDRMLMSHSVEGRFPFLDHRVAELAAAMPPRLKMKGLTEKYVLKRAAGDLVPPAVRQRPKQPYRAPDAASFFGLTGIAPPYVQELLDPQRLRRDGVFHPPAVAALVAKARQGQITSMRDNMALVGVLSTQLLLDQFTHSFGRYVSHADIGAADSAVHR